MNKEHDDNKACYLDMPGGYHSTHPYPQKFVRAKQSQHPSPAPSSGKEVNASLVMKKTLGR